MKARHCGRTAREKRERRLHYCGTCKTLGAAYSQRARALLNHDAVFLGELLGALDAATAACEEWSQTFQSYNCLALPQREDEIPRALRFATTANIALTEFKIVDKITDSQKFRWRAAQKLLNDDFVRAAAQLNAWDFPIDDLREILSSQQAREAVCANECNPSENLLKSLAAPTAEATAMFFAHGALVCGCDAKTQDAMRALGHAFGELVYLLDAFDDYERDFRSGEFNAFRAAFGWTSGKFSVDERKTAAEILLERRNDAIAALRSLPISHERSELFESRLRANLAAKIERRLPVVQSNFQIESTSPVASISTLTASDKSSTHAISLTAANEICSAKPRVRRTLAERFRRARAVARRISKEHFDSSCASAFSARFKKPLVFASVVLIALVFPRHAAHARSLRECVDASLNLMHIGAAFSSFVAAFSLPTGEGLGTKAARKAARKAAQAGSGDGGAGGGSGGGWCTDCVCCCDCCSESEGCCDGCSGCGDCGSCCDCGGYCDC